MNETYNTAFAKQMAEAEELAELFHYHYERLAPTFEYGTRTESAVPWKNVPTKNRNLMIATASKILEAGKFERYDQADRDIAAAVNQSGVTLGDLDEALSEIKDHHFTGYKIFKYKTVGDHRVNIQDHVEEKEVPLVDYGSGDRKIIGKVDFMGESEDGVFANVTVTDPEWLGRLSAETSDHLSVPYEDQWGERVVSGRKQQEEAEESLRNMVTSFANDSDVRKQNAIDLMKELDFSPNYIRNWERIWDEVKATVEEPEEAITFVQHVKTSKGFDKSSVEASLPKEFRHIPPVEETGTRPRNQHGDELIDIRTTGRSGTELIGRASEIHVSEDADGEKYYFIYQPFWSVEFIKKLYRRVMIQETVVPSPLFDELSSELDEVEKRPKDFVDLLIEAQEEKDRRDNIKQLQQEIESADLEIKAQKVIVEAEQAWHLRHDLYIPPKSGWFQRFRDHWKKEDPYGYDDVKFGSFPEETEEPPTPYSTGKED